MNKPTAKKETVTIWGREKLSASERKFMQSMKPLAPAVMAKKLIDTHGRDKAMRDIVSPNAQSWIKDANGNPVIQNENSNYWQQVQRAMK